MDEQWGNYAKLITPVCKGPDSRLFVFLFCLFETLRSLGLRQSSCLSLPLECWGCRWEPLVLQLVISSLCEVSAVGILKTEETDLQNVYETVEDARNILKMGGEGYTMVWLYKTPLTESWEYFAT